MKLILSDKLLWMVMCCLIVLFVDRSLSQAQPFTFNRADLLSGEAKLYQSLRQGLNVIQQKPFEEMVSEFDINEVQLSLQGSSQLPNQGTIRISFTAQIDDLTTLPFFMLGPDLSDLSMRFSRSGEAWQDAQLMIDEVSLFSVILPESLAQGERGLLEFNLSFDWSDELSNPQSAFASAELSHFITSRYLPFNGETGTFDHYQLITEIESRSGEHPGGLGRLISRPDEGNPGLWRYQSEIPSTLMIYGMGGTYPQSIDGRIEVFDLPRSLAIGDHSLIVQAMSEVIPVYEALYGVFPFSRLAAYPITDEAGVAMGPQGQLLLPWYLWLPEIEEQIESQFDIYALIYHEVAHQYFFNSVRLHPSPIVGQAWLSEAMAEFSSIRALEELQGRGAWGHWLNHYQYLSQVNPRTEVPIASIEVNSHPNYSPIVYFRGSNLVYGIYQRMADFTDKLRECVEGWSGLFIGRTDMFDCFRSMQPKEEYAQFDVNTYITRYFSDITRDMITVEAHYVDDSRSTLSISQSAWPDALELFTAEGSGEIGRVYLPRVEEQVYEHSHAALVVDPNITTPRVIMNRHGDDVDLNGIVDGQDALDVLFEQGKSLNDLSEIFPEHLDVDGNGVISYQDITEIQRNIGVLY